ncbi:MAG TPA: four helix bundle protein [Anaerolineae bacterium]|nr:four helix bundle protein [Anaerolineae bacterium]
MYKLNDAEAEAAETQTWLEFAVKCGYLEAEVARPLYELYDRILGKLAVMIRQPEKWVIGEKGTR